MLEFAFILCGIIIISFILFAVGRKWGKVRITAGSLMAVSGITLIPLFYKVQKMNGNPDAGKEFEQLYIPLGIFAAIAIIGAIIVWISIKKHLSTRIK